MCGGKIKEQELGAQPETRLPRFIPQLCQVELRDLGRITYLLCALVSTSVKKA